MSPDDAGNVVEAGVGGEYTSGPSFTYSSSRDTSDINKFQYQLKIEVSKNIIDVPKGSTSATGIGMLQVFLK